MNAFSVEHWRGYAQLFDSLTKDGYDVRAAVISSVFPKIFTAGIDRMSCAIVISFRPHIQSKFLTLQQSEAMALRVVAMGHGQHSRPAN